VLGESVCHDGACLTVTEVGRETFTVLAGAETLARTTLGHLRVASGSTSSARCASAIAWAVTG